MNEREKTGKPEFDKLVQHVVESAWDEGYMAHTGTADMQPFYDRTHADVNTLLDAIAAALAGDGSER